MEDCKYKLSIIIPMYNAEKYIANCLNSILNSDLPRNRYEVIIINDGSKDNCPQIAQEYVQQYDNFSYLEQENQGQSVARNYGLSVARGEYVWFVDSDDKVDKDLNKLLERITDLGNPDVFSFYLQYVTEEEEFITKAFQFSGEYNKLFTGRDAVIMGYQPSSVCVFFIRLSFLEEKQLKFYPGIYHQDSEFSYRMMSYAKHVYFSDYVPYIYIRHENTVVTTRSKEKIIKKHLDDITIVKSFLKLSEEFRSSDSTLSNVIIDHCDGLVFGIVYSLYKKNKDNNSKEINHIVLNKLIENGFYPMKIRLKPVKRNLFKILLNRKNFLFS